MKLYADPTRSNMDTCTPYAITFTNFKLVRGKYEISLNSTLTLQNIGGSIKAGESYGFLWYTASKQTQRKVIISNFWKATYINNIDYIFIPTVVPGYYYATSMNYLIKL